MNSVASKLLECLSKFRPFLLDVLVAIGLRLYNVHCKLYMVVIVYKVDGVLVKFHRYGLPDLGDNYVN